jgi:ICEA protein
MTETKRELFLELAQPNEEGFSRKVYVTEFTGKYDQLKMGNGGSWCREEGSLGKEYNVQRHIERGAIYYIQLHGYKKVAINKAIRADIVRCIRAQTCAILGTGNVEVDHKDGRRDDPRLFNKDTQKESDFQPLSKAANNAKRQHCKECRDTDIRFDARVLGYGVSQVQGDMKYRGSCVGCYWYNPKEFNRRVSE